jgi:hypothetical protein
VKGPQLQLDWDKVFEFTWRILVFLVAIAIIVVVSVNWNRWEAGKGWQRTNDAYLQSALTPVASKVAGYVLSLPVQDYERVHRGKCWRSWWTMISGRPSRRRTRPSRRHPRA